MAFFVFIYLQVPFNFQTEENIFILSFKYKTPENPQSITYFAFTYPFSYGEMQQMLDNIDRRFANTTASSKDDIYYIRECVCHSLEGRRVDLLTISSHHSMSGQREPRLKNLFPDQNIPRPFCFMEKKVSGENFVSQKLWVSNIVCDNTVFCKLFQCLFQN